MGGKPYVPLDKQQVPEDERQVFCLSAVTNSAPVRLKLYDAFVILFVAAPIEKLRGRA